MECLEKPICNKYTKEELEQISIPKPMEEVRKQVLYNWDAIAKPIDGLGSFETLTAQIGAITGEEKIDISKKAVLILCADNGIVEENISQSGQEVTAAVARSIAGRHSSVCQMAEVAGADIIPVDIGIQNREEIHGVLNKKIRCGTRNFFKRTGNDGRGNCSCHGGWNGIGAYLKRGRIPDTGNRRDGDWQYNDQQCYGSGTLKM